MYELDTTFQFIQDEMNFSPLYNKINAQISFNKTDKKENKNFSNRQCAKLLLNKKINRYIYINIQLIFYITFSQISERVGVIMKNTDRLIYLYVQ